MREIKFRAWTKHNEMLSVIFLAWDRPKAQVMVRKQLENTHTTYVYDLDDVKLLQYTGLKDRNGKEIYEGDIVKPIHPNYKGIGYAIDPMEWHSDRKTYEEWYGYNFSLFGTNEDVEVIGNIYENPELLKT